MDEPLYAGPINLSEYAAAIAPHIDRLAIAVHTHARPAGIALIQAYDLPNAGILVDMRPILLGAAITFADLATINRYAPRDGLQAALDEHLRQGMLERRHDDYHLTPSGRALLIALTAGQGEAITRLWPDLDERTLEIASSAIFAASALPAADYPAFHLMRNAPDPPDNPTAAHVLLTRLTTLRYLRADAHALARATHTDRDTVEAETNALAAPPWAALDSSGRKSFLNQLAALAD